MGEGDGVREEDRMITAEEALEKIIGQVDNVIETAEKDITPEAKMTTKEVEILPGFASKVEGEILLLDSDNINVSYTLSHSFPGSHYHGRGHIVLVP